MTAATVILRLEGPVQGWGDAGSRWDYRTTMPRPTKSGVLGLVAAALGRDFTDDVSDLAALKFGVRADRPGHIEFDYRMAGGGTFPLDAATAWADPKAQAAVDARGRVNYGAPRAGKNYAWTEAAREGLRRSQTFLADAGFLVSLTGPAHLVREIAHAVDHPARLVSLGRRANPPSHPLLHALLEGDRHNDWAHHTPLTDTATTDITQWTRETENVSSPDAFVVYEQPPTPGTRGSGHGPTLMTTTTITPTTTTEDTP